MKKKKNLPYLSPQASESAIVEQMIIAASVEADSLEGLVKDEEYNW